MWHTEAGSPLSLSSFRGRTEKLSFRCPSPTSQIAPRPSSCPMSHLMSCAEAIRHNPKVGPSAEIFLSQFVCGGMPLKHGPVEIETGLDFTASFIPCKRNFHFPSRARPLSHSWRGCTLSTLITLIYLRNGGYNYAIPFLIVSHHLFFCCFLNPRHSLLGGDLRQ